MRSRAERRSKRSSRPEPMGSHQRTVPIQGRKAGSSAEIVGKRGGVSRNEAPSLTNPHLHKLCTSCVQELRTQCAHQAANLRKSRLSVRYTDLDRMGTSSP